MVLRKTVRPTQGHYYLSKISWWQMANWFSLKICLFDKFFQGSKQNTARKVKVFWSRFWYYLKSVLYVIEATPVKMEVKLVYDNTYFCKGISSFFSLFFLIKGILLASLIWELFIHGRIGKYFMFVLYLSITYRNHAAEN